MLKTSEAERLGLQYRQTLSAIETGERRLSAEELLLAVKVLGASLERFTDPFLQIGEGRFSWRQTGVMPARLADYERDAGRCIPAYRALAAEQGHQPPLDRRSLRPSTASCFEDAVAAEYDLGDVPADRPALVMQEAFGILVLMVDAITGVSGARRQIPT